MSVIVPCRNEAGGIEHCLRSVMEQEPPAGGFEIIVADGLSDDGTLEILTRLAEEVGGQLSVVNGHAESPHSSLFASHGERAEVGCAHLRVILNPARIQAAGLNAAIRVARGGIIIRMDAHTIYAHDYLRQCVSTLKETRAENVGGPARTMADHYTQRAVAAAYHSSFAVGGARFHDADYEGYVDTVTYGCWHKATFERVGFFDEELVRNEDDEFNLRLTRAGGKVWQSPKIKSWYRPRAYLGALFKQYMQYGYWKVRVIQKHKLPASWRHLVPGAFVLTLAVLFLLSAASFLLPALRHPISISIFSFQLSAFSFVFLIALTAYALALITASLITASRTEWKLFWILPLVFPCYHFGYGIGFLRGIWDFVICHKSADKSFETLTR